MHIKYSIYIYGFVQIVWMLMKHHSLCCPSCSILWNDVISYWPGKLPYAHTHVSTQTVRMCHCCQRESHESQ